MTRQNTLLFLCFLAAAEIVSAQPNGPVPSIQQIVTRMAQARSSNHAQFRPYTVTRDYRLFGKDQRNAKSQVIADVSFVPPGRKNFAIRQAYGAGMGEKVVRRMLTSEVEISSDKKTEISPDNYEIRFIRQESFRGRRCYLLELHPRREDTHLMVGKVWVDAETYLIQRAEGEPAKKPSWWVRDLHFALSYGNISGMWLPVTIEATAIVRIIGKCTLVSRNVGFNVGQFAANSSLPVTKDQD